MIPFNPQALKDKKVPDNQIQLITEVLKDICPIDGICFEKIEYPQGLTTCQEPPVACDKHAKWFLSTPTNTATILSTNGSMHTGGICGVQKRIRKRNNNHRNNKKRRH